MKVELEPGVWIAEGEGDPARTLDESKARWFLSAEDARKALIEEKIAEILEGRNFDALDEPIETTREILALIKEEIFESLADWGGPQHKYFNDAVNVLQKHFDGKAGKG